MQTNQSFKVQMPKGGSLERMSKSTPFINNQKNYIQLHF